MTIISNVGLGVGGGLGAVPFAIRSTDSMPAVFTSVANRDTYYTNNPGDIAGTTDLGRGREAVGIGPNDGSTVGVTAAFIRNAANDGWIPIATNFIGPAGPAGATGPAGMDGMGVDFTNFADGDLLRYNLGTGTTEPAALRQLTALVSSSQTIRPPGDRAIDIGPISAVSEGSTVSFLDRSRGFMFGAVVHDTTAGAGPDRRAFYFRPQDTFTTTPSGANTSETFTGTTLQFTIVNANLGTALEYRDIQRAAGSTEITGANLTIRRNSHTDVNPVFDYIRDINGAAGFTLNGGAGVTMTTIDLAREHLFLQGETLYITLTGDGTTPLNILGQTIGGQTVPSVDVYGRLGDIVFIEDYLGLPTSDNQVLASTTTGVRSWVDQGGGADGVVDSSTIDVLADNTVRLTLGRTQSLDNLIDSFQLIAGTNITLTPDAGAGTITIAAATGMGVALPSLHNFSIDIPSRVDIGTNLNVQHTITFDVTNYSLLTGLTLIVTDGDDITLTTPIRDGVQTQTVTLAGTNTGAATTITFQLSGTHAGGTVTSNIVTITVSSLQAQEQAYAGGRVTNDFATVDVAQLTSFDVTQSGTMYDINESVPDTYFFGLLSPTNRDPVSLINSVLNIDELANFTMTTDVRTIGGLSYNLLTLQNNSGFQANFRYRVTTE